MLDVRVNTWLREIQVGTFIVKLVAPVSSSLKPVEAEIPRIDGTITARAAQHATTNNLTN
jgi:hypothetical protein